MIVDLISTAVFGVLTAVMGVVPAFTFEFGGGTIVGTFSNTADRVVPVTEIISVLGILMAIQLFIVVWRFFEWIWEHIPFKAT